MSYQTNLDDLASVEKRYGAVVLLDALGTKGRWLREEARLILQKNESFVSFLEGIMSGDNKLFEEVGQPIKSEVLSFSDTIIITTSTNWNEKLNELSSDAVLLNFMGVTVAEAIGKAIVRNIFLRGCISFGVFYVSSKRKMIIGPTIDEAAEYYMKPQWIGVSVTRSAHHVLSQMEKNHESFEGVWEKEDILMDDAIERGGWVVRWPSINVESDGEDGKGKRRLSKVRSIIEEQLKNAPNMDIFLKWRNTLIFFERVEKSLNLD